MLTFDTFDNFNQCKHSLVIVLESMEDDEQQPTETPRKAYLGRYEALNAAIEQKSDTLAPGT